jgi:hypothetical protein
LIFSDTDSLIYNVTGDEDPLKNEMGEFLGQLTNELKGDMIEFVAIAPKTYAYREQLPDETVRVSSVPLKKKEKLVFFTDGQEIQRNTWVHFCRSNHRI